MTENGDGTEEGVRPLIARALDRHGWLREITGGDHAALSEVAAAQEAVLSQESPDLAVMLRLAVVRDRLIRRGAGLSADPGEWAEALTALAEALSNAGDPARAEALARTITDPDARAWALNFPVRARRLADDAENLARAITDPGQREQILVNLVTALGEAGESVRAEALARTVTDPRRRARALLLLAGASTPERAAHLTAQALACGPWQDCLNAVLEADPAAVSVLDDLLTENPFG